MCRRLSHAQYMFPQPVGTKPRPMTFQPAFCYNSSNSVRIEEGCWKEHLNHVRRELSFSDELKYDSSGLIPAVVQDAETGEVLMVAYMNRESVDKTLETGKTCFWSRSRQEFWIKGGSSGHYQYVKGVYTDCDKDCLLIKVDQTGAACHDGYRSCFYRHVGEGGAVEVVAEKVFDPDQVYKKE